MRRSGGDRKAGGREEGLAVQGRENREASITHCKFPSGEAGWRGAHSIRGLLKRRSAFLRERHSLS